MICKKSWDIYLNSFASPGNIGFAHSADSNNTSLLAVVDGMTYIRYTRLFVELLEGELGERERKS